MMYLMRRAGWSVTYAHVDLSIYLFGSIFLVAYMTKALRVFYHDRLFASFGKSLVLIASTLLVIQIYRFILFIVALYSA